MKAARNKDGSLVLLPDFGTYVRNETTGRWEFYTVSSVLKPNGMYDPVKIEPDLFPELKWEDEPIEVTVTETHDCSKCVISDCCEHRDRKPLVINGKCTKYWERKYPKVRGIYWHDMDVDERVNHPIWKEMSPSERLAAIALESRPDHSVIKEFRLIDDITNAISEKYPSITKLKYTIGYEQGMQAVINYLDDTTKMEILKRIKESYEKTDDKSEE